MTVAFGFTLFRQWLHLTVSDELFVVGNFDAVKSRSSISDAIIDLSDATVAVAVTADRAAAAGMKFRFNRYKIHYNNPAKPTSDRLIIV